MLTINNTKKYIKLSKKAKKQIYKLIKKKKKTIGIKIGIKKFGCAGYKYYLKFKKNKICKKKETIIKKKKIKFYINKKEMQFIKGIKIDFLKKGLNKSFKFSHIAKLQTCGCGESFNIKNSSIN